MFAYTRNPLRSSSSFLSEYSSSSSHLAFLKDTTGAFSPISQATDYRLAPPSGIVTLLQNLGILCPYVLASASCLWKSGIFSICSQTLRLQSRNVALYGLMGDGHRDTGILRIHCQFLGVARLATSFVVAANFKGRFCSALLRRRRVRCHQPCRQSPPGDGCQHSRQRGSCG